MCPDVSEVRKNVVHDMQRPVVSVSACPTDPGDVWLQFGKEQESPVSEVFDAQVCQDVSGVRKNVVHDMHPVLVYMRQE